MIKLFRQNKAIRTYAIIHKTQKLWYRPWLSYSFGYKPRNNIFCQVNYSEVRNFSTKEKSSLNTPEIRSKKNSSSNKNFYQKFLLLREVRLDRTQITRQEFMEKAIKELFDIIIHINVNGSLDFTFDLTDLASSDDKYMTIKYLVDKIN